jgi:hypothetical protein
MAQIRGLGGILPDPCHPCDDSTLGGAAVLGGRGVSGGAMMSTPDTKNAKAGCPKRANEIGSGDAWTPAHAAMVKR